VKSDYDDYDSQDIDPDTGLVRLKADEFWRVTQFALSRYKVSLMRPGKKNLFGRSKPVADYEYWTLFYDTQPLTLAVKDAIIYGRLRREKRNAQAEVQKDLVGDYPPKKAQS